MTKNEKEFYNRIDEILHYIWDPIDISGIPPARDTYKIDVATIYDMFMNKKPAEELVRTLTFMSNKRDGVKPSISRDEKVIKIISEYYYHIFHEVYPA